MHQMTKKLDIATDKLLFIRGNSSHDFIFEGLEKAGYVVLTPYSGNTILFRIMREFWFRLKLPAKSVWFNKKILSRKCETIIVYSPQVTPDFVIWLRKQMPGSRIILQYTNIVARSKNIPPNSIPDDCCEKWSWDEEDCDRYHLHQSKGNGYFAYWCIDKKPVQYDILFIGRDKGRLAYLSELEDDFSRLGLRTCFYVAADHVYERFKNPCYKRLLRYDEVLEMTAHARAILDIVPEKQTARTMRVLESIFNEIKLITNNRHLAEYDFYHEDNIFILGQNDLDQLPAFLEKPYHRLDPQLIEKYEFRNCLNEMLTPIV
jgi:hypothetical protein